MKINQKIEVKNKSIIIDKTKKAYIKKVKMSSIKNYNSELNNLMSNMRMLRENNMHLHGAGQAFKNRMRLAISTAIVHAIANDKSKQIKKYLDRCLFLYHTKAYKKEYLKLSKMEREIQWN